MDDLKTYTDYLLFPLVALFGGIVKYLRSLKNFKSFSWFAFFVEALTALFLGLLIVFIGKEMKASLYWLGACSSLAGWLGVDFVKHLIRQYTKIPISISTDEKKPS